MDGTFERRRNEKTVLGVPVRRIFRMIWWLVCTTVFLALPVVLWDFRRSDYKASLQAYVIAGLFVLMSVPISVYEVAMHFEYYTRPKLQIHVIRIMWMVPVYGMDSWLCLRFAKARLYLDPIREIYEAYVIYNFYMYLIHFLEDEVGDLALYLQRKEPVQHLLLLKKVFRPWQMGHEFITQTKLGVMSYVVLRPVTTLVSVIAEPLGVYGENTFDPTQAWLYCMLINNLSQAYAVYCLILIYKGTHEELRPLNPAKKFIVVKAVVFFSFWQGVLFSILIASGVLKGLQDYSAYGDEGDPSSPSESPGLSPQERKEEASAQLATSLQNLVICIECFPAALAHAWAYPPKDYRDPEFQSRGVFRNIRDMFDVRDVVTDVQDYMDTTVQRTTNTITYGVTSASFVATTPLRYFRKSGWSKVNENDQSMGQDPDGNSTTLLQIREPSSHTTPNTNSQSHYQD